MATARQLEVLTEDNLIRVAGWARDGLSEEQISKNLGIAYSTLREWKKTNNALSAALKNSKEVCDRIVENALYNRAIGIKETVRKPIKVKDVLYEEGKRVAEHEHIEYAEEEVYIPPDTTAQIFWLKNRKPEDWRDKREVQEKLEVVNDGFLEALKGTAAEDWKDEEKES